MRITQTMLSNNMLRNLNNSYERLGKYQEQLYTQKKITRPSDDPVIAVKGMQNRTSLIEVEQHERNLSNVYNWLENSEDSLEKAGDVIHRVSELVTQANNGSLTNDDRQKLETEIEQLKEQLISIANTQVSGKYIFSGSSTNEKPVNYDGANFTYNGNQDKIEIEVSKGVQLQVNQTADNLFVGALKDLHDLQSEINDPSLRDNDPDLSGFIEGFQNHLNTITAARSKIGAVTNRAELIESRLGSQKVIATKMISENEDIDVEEVIMNLKTQESIHRATLSVGSSIIQPTLVDFIR
ncbi:flagellar hook-associated protein FlgL [Bacillus timonensis]|uniref:flagellar hook-associated protein FlgL n=1 Tax=Bacillus timonensis TaxID=1033734 RepID=UPI0002885212|nr:flagellar hook-associated protein FlgL [Bacillus timonensis]